MNLNIRTSDIDMVVVGLGYVGLPLSVAAAQSGLQVAGLDVDADRVAAITAGEVVTDDVPAPAMAGLLATGFHATTNPAVVANAAAVVICVPTPLHPDRGPDLTNVRAVGATIAPYLRHGQVVVLESTSYPGTTEEVLRPLLEYGSGLTAGNDFGLAYSPERIDPGNAKWGVTNTPKVIGGLTPACSDAAEKLYDAICDVVVVAKSPREAEMAKLLENTYRHVNIALVNEMAAFCDELSVDLWDAIRCAATKPFGYHAFYPGPGVGGHCIPIDPSYLGYKVRTLGYPFRFVELAQEINDRMPGYVTQRVQRLLNDHEKPVKGSRVLLLGVTYKPDVADDRESPAVPLAKRLLELGAYLSYHDPHVSQWTVNGYSLVCEPDLNDVLSTTDCIVLLQPHREYDLHAIAKQAPLVLDTRGVMTGDSVERL